MRKIKSDDEIIVIAGRDKGKRGKVVKILKDDRLIVSGIQMVKKHQKPNPQAGVQGGIVEMEAPIQISNVAILKKTLEDGKKIRVFKSNGEAVDA